jgi:TonB family protein
MDRLQKKCVIASGIMHGTLVVLLLVGPAFLGSESKPVDPKEIIDFIPAMTIDKAMTGGGNPNVTQVIPPPQMQPQPQPQLAPPQPRPEPPQPKPVRQPEPEPEPEPVKPKLPANAPKPVERDTPKNDPDSLEVSNKRKAPQISLKPVTRKTSGSNSSAAEERARERAAAERRARTYESALNNIRSGASSGGINIPLRGPGGGGLPYAGFNQALVSTYMRAWLVPADAADSSGKVVAVITLRRDGSVISARVERRSGNSELDQSVQRALDKVSYVAPFPDSVKDSQKTFWLEFDPKAKRMMG